MLTDFLTPMNEEERTSLINSYYTLDDAIEEGREKELLTNDQLDQMEKEQKKIKNDYFDRLPRIALSQCPFCDTPLKRVFDPWGLDGFWWQESESLEFPEPEPCSHFSVLLGAVNLNQLPPKGGRAEAYPGPEVPFVIPAILELPTMVSVVSSIPMHCGYTAYPIAYFSEEPPPLGSLTQPWTKKTYIFEDEDGDPCWSIKTDPWDFELRPWVEQGKVKWIEPENLTFVISQASPSEFPYADLPGEREQLIIQNDQLTTTPPPDGEDIDPFAE